MIKFDKPNLTYETLLTFQSRIREVISGETKLLFVGGPAGIAKTTMCNSELKAHYERQEKQWRQLPPESEVRLKNTAIDQFGIESFVNPSFAIPGYCRPRQFYMHLCDQSAHGKIVVIDDPSALADPLLQGIILQATDDSRKFTVTWDVSTKLGRYDDEEEFVKYPKRFHFYGGLIIISNMTEEEYHRKILPGVQSRAKPLFFPRNREDLKAYAVKLAFEGGGLLRYLRTIGFTGTDQDGVSMLRQVLVFFLKHDVEPDFRILCQLTFDRFKYGDQWEAQASTLI